MYLIEPRHQEKVALRFKSEHNPVDNRIRSNVSACVRTGENLWLGFDEGTRIERLRWTGKSWADHKSFSLEDFFELPGGKDEAIDIEGLAFSGNYLWVTGSHSKKRGKLGPTGGPEDRTENLCEIQHEANRYLLGCIPCVQDEKGDFTLFKECSNPERPGKLLKSRQVKIGKKGNKLTRSIAEDPLLAPFLKLPGKENGFDIEGIAVSGKRVYLGLRGPVLRGYGLILEVQFKEKNGYLKPQKIGENKARFRKHFIDLKGMGLREISPYIVEGVDRGLLLLAGPTMALDGVISLWHLEEPVPNRSTSILSRAKRLYDVSLAPASEYGKDRAEGIAMLEDQRIIVVYDSPSEHYQFGSHGLFADVMSL